MILIGFVVAVTSGNGMVYAQGREETRGATVIEMSLAEAVHVALRFNRAVKSAHLTRVAEKFDLTVARNKFHPKVTLTASPNITRSDSRSGELRSETAVSAINADISATKLIKTGGEFLFIWNRNDQWAEADTGNSRTAGNTWRAEFSHHLLKGAGTVVNTASVTLAEIKEQVNLFGLKDSVTATVNETILSFRNFAQARRRVEIAESSIKRVRDHLEINKTLIDMGRLPATELIQSQSDLANREFAFQTALNAMDRTRLAFLKVLDIDKQSRIRPIEPKMVAPIEPVYKDCIEAALKNRSDYLGAQYGVRTAEIETLLAKDNLKWDLDLKGDYALNNVSSHGTSNVEDTRWSVGLKLAIPLYGDLTREQRRTRAWTSLKQAEILLEDLKDTIALEVEDAIRNVGICLRQMEMAKRARALSEKKFAVEKEKFKAGRSANFQLVSFHNELVDAQNTELDAAIDYLNALTALDEKLGTTLATWKIDYNREYDKWPGT